MQSRNQKCATLLFSTPSVYSLLHCCVASVIARAATPDYTDGVKGVGIVNAMEIVSAYPGDRGLDEFREWIYSTAADVKPKPVGADASDAQKAAWVRAMFQARFFQLEGNHCTHNIVIQIHFL